jgi:hypothetical protein
MITGAENKEKKYERTFFPEPEEGGERLKFI